jgi:hypothetical protein
MPPPAVPKAPQPIGQLAHGQSGTGKRAGSSSGPASALAGSTPRLRRSRTAATAAAGIIALAAVSAAGLLLSADPVPEPAPASLAHAAPKPKQPKPKVQPAAAERPREPLKIELLGVPAGARIELDGAAASGPTLELTRDESTHVVRVTKQGFAPWEQTLTANRDQQLTVELTPLRKPDPKTVAESAASEPRRPKPRSAPAAASAAHGSKPPSALRQLDF